MKKKLIVLSGLVLSATPMLAFAQLTTVDAVANTCNLGTNGTLFGIMCRVAQLFNAAVPVLMGLAVIWFIWGVISYVIADDEEAKSTGRDRIIYGIIGFAVIIGLWGLVNVVRNTFRLTNSTQVEFPSIPTSIDRVPQQ